MKRFLGAISYIVRDYDEAIEYFVDKLGFQVLEDNEIGNSKRWILLSPQSSETYPEAACLLLAKAATAEQASRVGNQTGNRVFLFLHTDDFFRDYESMNAKGVHFLEEPRNEQYGIVAVFEDLYGNKWDLLQSK